LSAAPAFGIHAARLAAGGYDVIPISRVTDPVKHPGKQPAMREGWQNGCPKEAWPSYASCGVGILTKNTPALDIDIRDPELAETIQELADEFFGDAPYRIGEPPKRLMPFRLEGEPFDKMRLDWWSLGHERHEPQRPPAVEILARGQQFVALGIHPGTGKPYTWHRDPDLELPRALLPPMCRAKAEKFLKATAAALGKLGAIHIRLRGAIEEPRKAIVVPGPWLTQEADAERIAAALRSMGNPNLHYDDWIRIGHAIKAALPGPEGKALWERWSALSPKNNPRITSSKWETFKPRAVTAGTIFWEASR
jgi:putative DNA primase/helicase